MLVEMNAGVAGVASPQRAAPAAPPVTPTHCLTIALLCVRLSRLMLSSPCSRCCTAPCPALQPLGRPAAPKRSRGTCSAHQTQVQPARRAMAAAAAACGGRAAAAGAPAGIDEQLVARALQRHPRIILGTGSSSRRGGRQQARAGVVWHSRRCACRHGAACRRLRPPPHLPCPPPYLPAPCPAAIMDELAARYGFTYEVAKADIDEKAIRHEDAQHLVRPSGWVCIGPPVHAMLLLLLLLPPPPATAARPGLCRCCAWRTPRPRQSGRSCGRRRRRRGSRWTACW